MATEWTELGRRIADLRLAWASEQEFMPKRKRREIDLYVFIVYS